MTSAPLWCAPLWDSSNSCCFLFVLYSASPPRQEVMFRVLIWGTQRLFRCCVFVWFRVSPGLLTFGLVPVLLPSALVWSDCDSLWWACRPPGDVTAVRACRWSWSWPHDVQQKADGQRQVITQPRSNTGRKLVIWNQPGKASSITSVSRGLKQPKDHL